VRSDHARYSAAGGAQAEAVDLDGQRKRPSVSTSLETSAMTIMASDAAATIFSRSKRTAAALDEIEGRIDLVGAIDGDVEPVERVEIGQGDAQRLRLARRDFGGGNANTVETGGDLFAEQIDEMLGCRAGTQAEPHARPNLGQRHGRRLPLQVLAHGSLPGDIQVPIAGRQAPVNATKAGTSRIGERTL
jgi:hypothetical protein